MRAMARVHALLAVVRHGHRLGVPLRLIVDAPGTDGIHVAPVGLLLGVLERVAVHLRRRGDQEARALELGQAERVVRAVRADLERVQRQAVVVDRAGRAGQMEHVVDALLDVDVLDDVDVAEREVVVADVLDVLERAGVEVVQADDPVPLVQQVVAQMRAEEPGAAGHDRRRHGLPLSTRRASARRRRPSATGCTRRLSETSSPCTAGPDAPCRRTRGRCGRWSARVRSCRA